MKARARPAICRPIDGIEVPGWTTPLAIASLALLVLQMLDHRFVRGNVPLTLLVTGALAMLFVALYVALARADQRLVPLRGRPLTAVLLIILVANTVMHVVLVLPHLAEPARYSFDSAAATDCATQQILHGQNPYANVHMLTCLNSHGLTFDQSTPKRAGNFKSFLTFPTPNQSEAGVGYEQFERLMGDTYRQDLTIEQHDPHYAAPEFETRFNYPGAALWISLAASVFGLRDLVGLYLACVVCASILIYRQADQRLHWGVGLLLLADAPLLLDTSVGAGDAGYGFLLVIYWQVRERPIVAGLVLGVAAAMRQQVWFFLPFLLYLAYRTGGWRDVRRRGWSALVVFLACNLPFIALGPSDWLAGVMGPMSDPLFAQGVGLIALSIAFTKGQLGRPIFYAVLEFLVLAVAFRLYVRRCLATPGLAMLLPLLPPAFAWRSLHTYFLMLPLLATAVLGYRQVSEATRLDVGE